MTRKEFSLLRPGDVVVIGNKDGIGYFHYFEEGTEAIYVEPHNSIKGAIRLRQGGIYQSLKIQDVKMKPNE